MFVDSDESSEATNDYSRLFGLNPPKGIYFYVEFEHNLDHPLNNDVNPEESRLYSEATKTMAEARTIALASSSDRAAKIFNGAISLIPSDIDFNEEGVELPSVLGISGEGDANSAEIDEEDIVFCASVRIVDYRDQPIH